MNNVEDTEAPPEEERSSIVENLGQPQENENPTTENITPEQSDIIYYFMNYKAEKIFKGSLNSIPSPSNYGRESFFVV